MKKAPTIFIFGLGYVGRPLGHALAQAGWHVRGTTRSPEKLASEAAMGWQIYPFSDEVALVDPVAALDGVDAIISTITAIGGSDPVLDAHGDLLGEQFGDGKGWCGYVSATSIYPDQPNGFCYEDTVPAPATARGIARLEAEQRWQSLFDAEIFRAAGIYGPGRSPFDGLRNGTARIIKREGQVFNRIHVDDICAIIIAAMNQPRPGRIINLADNKPAPQGDVVRHAASLLGVEPPVEQTLEEANLSPMARTFYVSRRRVGSQVIKPELGVDLLYPDYETGLAAILRAEQDAD
ncbi:SDR family oxidoreductase [Alphaproteobacteria bacterium]|nr:SDR family oxidoreductase [Alphaproteobacteria bacterium]